ncbi:hypothetical protein HOY80DRAFT_985384 [Tuber brumale]|nr:hypothetical protein HOY80DRAFT_985384 [Tuber brumale]
MPVRLTAFTATFTIAVSVIDRIGITLSVSFVVALTLRIIRIVSCVVRVVVGFPFGAFHDLIVLVATRDC